ncbi:GDYXXLXY domain-containing protein [Pyxidicoccus fallax]|uniref:GDYXXLXY domain-containing protein n=1 Tax=Pyxidicoccus fallax TaxID=394095 RepID=A0A848LIA2_9BACT|nr:GDYXXLXY domain-containing protein [Pyxidicoccus fallax]NMO17453.1 GDYXXLXY domain-containing protein [Pyxidicoccus fallax]NPC82314.1 GDYXXLXY domain-containing protein [Pyxidicoccus fallax]
MRAAVIFGGLALALLVPAGLVVQKEHVLANGRTVLLELGPRDPRSLIQGDYMVLRYDISLQQWSTVGSQPEDGHLVLRLDEQGVGRFVRFDSPATPLAPGEFKLRYRVRDQSVRLGAEAFFFQEGHAERYERARYGELRVADSGASVLVGLRDDQRQPLGRTAP